MSIYTDAVYETKRLFEVAQNARDAAWSREVDTCISVLAPEGVFLEEEVRHRSF